jgi:hypothetical protein
LIGSDFPKRIYLIFLRPYLIKHKLCFTCHTFGLFDSMPSIAQEVDPNGSIGPDSSAYRVVVVGASYGGLTAVTNLLTLADGRDIKPGMVPTPPLDTPLKKPLEIFLIDERDGFCQSHAFAAMN